MKRILTANFALLTMALAPVASFARGRDRDCNREQQSYQSNFPVQNRYDNRGDVYDNSQRNSYATPRDYNYNYGPNGYGYSTNQNRWGRSAAYIGGGAAAGAVVGGLIGHGKGAAVGALAGGVGGYLYKKHKDRSYNGYGN